MNRTANDPEPPRTDRTDTIAAVATGPGGALAVIRMSGAEAINICDAVFRAASGKPLRNAEGYTLHYGNIVADGLENQPDPEPGNGTTANGSQKILDDVIVSVFRSPKSYTGEDMVEISCHGSRYIQQQIVNLLIRKGARASEAGEFTLRAFLAGKLDLSQAEAVADMIASTDSATHAIASNQMRGGYSADLSALRERLLTLASLLELELDFSEEDVEFADRSQLALLLSEIGNKISTLAESFTLGNVLKEGVAVAIAGSPNVGKSTLLNALLRDDRAMVSEIAGTTRDVIEESVNIGGVKFRFLDTAGIRHTDDRLERMGIDRTYKSIEKANIILLVVEAGEDLPQTSVNIADALLHLTPSGNQKLCVVINKTDKYGVDTCRLETIGGSSGYHLDTISLSAKTGENIDTLIDYLTSYVSVDDVSVGATIVSNSRHYESLLCAHRVLVHAQESLGAGISSELLAHDIHVALYYIGLITGKITTDEILHSIFSKFCIGK